MDVSPLSSNAVDPVKDDPTLLFDENLEGFPRLCAMLEFRRPAKRVEAVKDLMSVCEEVGFDSSCFEVVPLVDAIIQDHEPTVRIALAQTLYPLAQTLLSLGGDGAYDMLTTILLPAAAELNTDHVPQAREAAVDAMSDLGSLIPEASRLQSLEIFVQTLSYSPDFNNRIQATMLIDRLSTLLTEKENEDVMIPLFIVLCKDKEFKVRKAAAMTHLLPFHISHEVVESVYVPLVVALLEDSLWGVRRSMTQTLPDIASVLEAETRAQTLLPHANRLLTDDSRWVRQSAVEIFGQVLASVNSPELTPEDAVAAFCHLITAATNNPSDKDQLLHSAFSFPGVAISVGAERWGDLVPAFERLSHNEHYEVRRTVSLSLHELAFFLTTEQVAQHIIPVYDLYLNDIEEVRIGVLRNTSRILPFLPLERRPAYLNMLSTLRATTEAWRHRKIMAQQLPDLYLSSSLEEGKTLLLALTCNLCQDPVVAVRKTACKAVGRFFARFQPSESSEVVSSWILDPRLPPSVKKLKGVTNKPPEFLSPVKKDELSSFRADLLAKMKAYAHNRSYQNRLTFIRVAFTACGGMTPSEFRRDFEPELVRLASDSVANIRFSIARLLTQRLACLPGYSSESYLASLYSTLSGDKDRDVMLVINGGPDSFATFVHCEMDENEPASMDRDANHEWTIPKREPDLETLRALAPKNEASNS